MVLMRELQKQINGTNKQYRNRTTNQWKFKTIRMVLPIKKDELFNGIGTIIYIYTTYTKIKID